MSDNAINAVLRDLELTKVVRALSNKEGDPATILASLCTAIVAIEDIYQQRMRYHEERYAKLERETQAKIEDSRKVIFEVRDSQRKAYAWLTGVVGVILISAIMKVVMG